ncbi:Bacterial DNA-binding family protein [Babesia bovis T2Bo]|uniref:Uncharacterized protein n=1 Tax=Babesia bovis TaxID=5865 RepID=A7AMR9_BABBO|nr:Bacterial DNA-binding family protein [Babesia bovis T2Bo]EDO07853.1 Bacterial DNA-binding family protein [Babesia bovis T2Bo]BAN66185.1 conserved hypothetical protein [Babesia bovis]|eukprot:XP_001611421.1 hypothetical protein [Babesia bovis T2Bo]
MLTSSLLMTLCLYISAFVILPFAAGHRSALNHGLPSGVDTLKSAFIANPIRPHGSFVTDNARMSSNVDATATSSEVETVTKKQLISEIAQTTNMTQKDVGIVVDEFLKSIVKHLGENKEVSIAKFGLFHNSLRGPRLMKNLQTGEMYTAKPVYVPNVRFYEAVKAEVNQSLKPSY